MTGPAIEQLSLTQFAVRLASYKWTRKLTSIHIHHTWQPDHKSWKGRASVDGMRRFHVQENGWDDIAQHVTVAPDGWIWTGRDWNVRPASSGDRPGNNGTRLAGPFMIEMAGNFDNGHDTLEGPQLDAVLGICSMIQTRFVVPETSILFHRELGSPKTCPGSSIVKANFIEWLRAVRAEQYLWRI